MRQIIAASLMLAGTIPLGAQERTLDAGFSRTIYAEPTFYMSRAAYVAIFEIVGGDRVVQRYPRVEAQAATPLPAGESTLAWLDVNLGRIAEAPGTRTVFYRNGIAASAIGMDRAPIARTILLVASTKRLRVGASADFQAPYREAIDRQSANRSNQDRALAAVAEVVRPDDATVEVVTYVETLWLIAYPEFRGASISRVANESYEYGSPCDAIAPWAYAAYATWTDTSGCPAAYVPYFPGQYYYAFPQVPFRHGYSSGPHDGRPTDTETGPGFVPSGSPGVHRAKPLTTRTMPAEAMPVQAPGVTVFSGPMVDHRPIDGGARREPAPAGVAPTVPGRVYNLPATPEPVPRGEMAHPAEPNRYQPITRPVEPVHREPARQEPVARPPERQQPVTDAPVRAPAPARAPETAPAAAPAPRTPAPAARPTGPTSGAQQQPKRN